ncbi:Calcium-binding EF-hand [Cynara cardunculus var. scolymus]|uniref:non-specific serine/threonine protein kinase n=1 Tax=Cynara cardunculus var. scolymus TaxID=59895 RepID=A0A118K4Z1_CYNCS|nr:Calcium-binding EF-hand [Cynara cardunculus var. scolymus]
MGGCMSIANKKVLKKVRNNVKPITSLDQDHETAKLHADAKSGRPVNVNVLWESSGAEIYRRYRFGKELGRGEFGVTYECQDKESGEKVACKKISKSRLRTEIDVEDVRREVDIMRHLPSHPNIVRYKDVFEDKEAIYLVMELCEGGELFDRIVAKGHYTERAAALVTKTIVEVVQPENFLYVGRDENASLKAIDFGLSIFFEPEQRFREIVGSPYYMAPEVLRRNYGAEVDVWSAGVILYILLCGVPPFWAETEEGIAQAIIKGDVNYRRDPWPRVSQDAKSLVKAMLEPIPQKRPTVQQVLGSQWIQHAHNAPDIPLGEQVRARIQQFSLMNKFKKKVISADLDHNGVLNCEEFLTMVVHLKKISNEDQLRQAFHHFDRNRNGYIEFDELKECLFDGHLNPHNEKMVHEIIVDADLDKDGRISYPEFAAMMTTGIDWKMASRRYSRAMLNAISMKMFKDP